MSFEGSDRFAALRPYQVVLLVGPQRAGTTIAARILAHELERPFIDERDVKGDIGTRMEELRRRPGGCVVQCPGWTWTCHTLGGLEVAVVLVRRPVVEIVASQERIHWTHRCQPQELARYGLSRGVISEVKYGAWDERQRTLLGPHGFEIDYHSLRGHALWVEASERRDFDAKQTAVSGE